MTINMTDIPTQLATRLQIPTFAGQLIVTLLIMFGLLLPIAILKLKGSGWIIELGIEYLVLTTCIAIGWLPYWLLLAYSLLIALFFSGSIRKWLTGG